MSAPNEGGATGGAGEQSGETRHIAQADDGWIAIACEPDWCWVGERRVAFDSVASLGQPIQASPNVKVHGRPVYREGDIFKGTQGNGGRHIVSDTSLEDGYVKILDGHPTVKVNGRPVARHGSRCLINCDAAGKGGAMGMLYTEQKPLARTPSQPNNPDAPAGQRSSDKLDALRALRSQVASGKVEVSALDGLLDFNKTNAYLDTLIAKIKGEPDTMIESASEMARGALGLGKDVMLAAGGLAYEVAKTESRLPLLLLAELPRTLLLAQLNAQILAEKIRLGNITAATIGEAALDLGGVLIVPLSQLWKRDPPVRMGLHALGIWLQGKAEKLLARKESAPAKASEAKTGLPSARDKNEKENSGKKGGVHVMAAPAKISIKNNTEPEQQEARHENPCVGFIARKYESGTGGVATISNGAGDPGGVSYGAYQLSKNSGTLTQFLSSPENANFRQHFEGLEAGTEAFNDAYRSVVESSGSEFDSAQYAFIARTHYEPLANRARKIGFDMEDNRVREAIFSQSVNHSPVGNRKIMAAAIASLPGNPGAEQQVSALYLARGNYVAGLSGLTERTRGTLLDRYRRELSDVLAIHR
ncbi:hypothetical protein FNU76_08590 [Chitinimonas arctica]|uniref:Type VI secretion system spike protein VgrG3-like C-terminal domain-containing protein n=1 Tax=Chitinimonas arctica TaxID=2594795 RepID=A0A516SE27_9NEIS|nr:PAAR domain-containing protein [Chitinimonas arctica]QDQ26417.1 hypothetical protein FNU76_08590 [Chitinimonas arctica]